MLGWGPYATSGTIHGGHQGLVWNAGGNGYTVTAHFLEGTPPDRRLATLRAVAQSFRPPP